MNRRDVIKAVSAAVGVACLPRAQGMIGIIPGMSSTATSGVNPMGTNYAAGGGSSLSYESLPMFKNRVREGRGFTTAGSYNTTQVAISASGWPTTDFSLVPWEGTTVPSWLSAATSGNPMKGRFIGSGSESIVGTGCTIANVVHGSGGAYTTFDCYGISGTFRIDITGTTGGCTNVALYIAGYDLGTIDDVTQSSAYFPPSISKYSQMAGIRWMWMSDVVYNTGLNTSATRHTPSNCQTRGTWKNNGQSNVAEGYPAEWFAYFCKNCGPQTTAYFCLPVWEDGTNNSAGTYSNSLLTMINSVLIPSGNKVYLEIGNEFFDYPIGAATGQTMNTLSFNNGFSSDTSGYNAGIWNYLGYKLHALANMCRSIFGAAFGTQVKIVLASQTGSNGYANFMPKSLAYISTNYGAPSNDIQHLSIAPYVNLTNNAGDNSVAAVLADLSAQGDKQPYQSGSEHVSILAQHYGMTLIAYESGWQVNSEAAGNTYIPQAIVDPGMEGVMRDHIWKPMLDAGYQMIFNFESGVNSGSPAYAPEDEWSANYGTFISSGSPRFSAMTDIATGNYTPQRNLLSSRGQVFSGVNSMDNISGAAVGCTDSLSVVTSCWAMQFYVPAGMAGNYSAVINVTGSAATPTVEVNAATISTAAIAAGNNTVSITLKAGFNYLMIYNGAGITAVNSITLN